MSARSRRRRFIEAGHEVVVLDDLTTGHRAAVPAGATLHHDTYADADGLARLLERERIEAILHCAARSLVGESIREPARYYRDNVAGGVALLEAARAVGVGRVVFSSTAAVYGDPDSTPIPEDAPLRPINPYGESKRAFEGALALVRPRLRAAHREPSLLQRRRRDRRARRGPRPRDAPDPERARGGRGHPRADGLRRRLPDAGRHLHPRLHPRRRPRRRAPAGDRGDGARRPADRRLPRLQPRDRRRLLDPRGHRGRGTGRRARRSRTPSGRAGRATRRCWWRQPNGRPRSSAGRRRRPSLDEMVGSAWAWRQRHPGGYPD